ncbi:parkin coregulated gene protein homolog [Bradysia coprophila]|uniref:parkin coregulated gene protein homolog n=1 Tax=Bradysia coprophila TaxID=38358 RepID=UPI00187D77B3|nr:parkin coregulated gene protein homolog [Bradysia coprophila]
MATVKEFRISLGTDKKKNRPVAPFSQQSLQQNTRVVSPPRLNVFSKRPVKRTLFRKYFQRGDIPIERKIRDGKLSEPIDWVVPLHKLDYSIYLPLFFDGLAESVLPYKLFARSGIHEMLVVGGDKVLPVVPQLIFPIKRALNTRDPDIVVATLQAIQELITTSPAVGQALVPYYRQILPIFNLMREVNVNIGDKIDFNRTGHAGDMVEKTLQLLERTGGPYAYLNIKYMVPTYESVIKKN